MNLRYLIALTLYSSFVLAQEEVTPYPYLAYAQPVNGITIDGDLNDWPTSAKAYPIAGKMWGDDLASTEDFSANFRVAYAKSDNTLFLAIDIEDDVTITKDGPTWNNQDTYTFYINEQYNIKGSGIVRYTLADNLKDATDPTDNWDTGLDKYISWERLDYQIKHTGNKTSIELKYRLKDPIYAGRTIGLGQMVIDEDENDDGTGLGWVGRGGKSSYSEPGNLGVVVFADEDLQPGKITGKVRWNDPENPTQPRAIRLVAPDNPAQWFFFPLNDEGYFSATIPAGKWELHPGKTVFFDNDDNYFKAQAQKQQIVTVKGGQTTDFGEFVIAPAPKPALLERGNLLYAMDDAAKHRIDEAIKAYMAYYEIEGVSFAAWEKGKLVHKNTYGVKNNFTGEQVSPETLFEVASITKPAFAYVVLRLYDKGIIDLDKPLYEDLEFDLVKDHEYAKLVTARHVLSHQTGFPNWANGKIEFKFKPGNGFGYSGEGFEYLKRVIEKITGKAMNQLLQEELVKPLNLQNFYFQYDEEATKHKSNGHYNGFPGRIDFAEAPGVAWSLITTPADYLKFAEAIHERKGLQSATYDLMFSKQNELEEGFHEEIPGIKEHMGLGWFVEQTPYGRVIKHGGNNGDFKATFKLYDDLGLAFMITTNGNTGHFLSSKIEKWMIDTEAMKGME